MQHCHYRVYRNEVAYIFSIDFSRRNESHLTYCSQNHYLQNPWGSRHQGESWHQAGRWSSESLSLLRKGGKQVHCELYTFQEPLQHQLMQLCEPNSITTCRPLTCTPTSYNHTHRYIHTYVRTYICTCTTYKQTNYPSVHASATVNTHSTIPHLYNRMQLRILAGNWMDWCQGSIEVNSWLVYVVTGKILSCQIYPHRNFAGPNMYECT